MVTYSQIRADIKSQRTGLQSGLSSAKTYGTEAASRLLQARTERRRIIKSQIGTGTLRERQQQSKYLGKVEQHAKGELEKVKKYESEVETGLGKLEEYEKKIGEYEKEGYKVEKTPEGKYQFSKIATVTRTVSKPVSSTAKKDFYAKIDKQIADIDKAINNLKRMQSRLTKPTAIKAVQSAIDKYESAKVKLKQKKPPVAKKTIKTYETITKFLDKISGVSPLAQRSVASIKQKLLSPTMETHLTAQGITQPFYEDVGEITFPEFTSGSGKTYEGKTFTYGEESYEDIVGWVEGRSQKVLQDEYVASGYVVPSGAKEQIVIPPGVSATGLEEEFIKGAYEESIGYEREVPEGFIGPVKPSGLAGFESLYRAKTVGSKEWVKEHGEFLVGEGEEQEKKTWAELRKEYGPAMTLEYEEGVGYTPVMDVEGWAKREHERAVKEGDYGFLAREFLSPIFSSEVWEGVIQKAITGSVGEPQVVILQRTHNGEETSKIAPKIEDIFKYDPALEPAIATGLYEYSRAVEEGDVVKIGTRLLSTPIPNVILGMGIGGLLGYGGKAVGGYVASRLPGISTVSAMHPVATTTLKVGVGAAFLGPPVYDTAATYQEDQSGAILKGLNLAAMLGGTAIGYKLGTSAYAKRTPTSFLGSEGRVNPFIKKQITKLSTGTRQLWGRTGIPQAMEGYKFSHLRGLGELPSERYLSMARQYYGAKSAVREGLYKFGLERGLISKKPMHQSGYDWDIYTHPELTGEYETGIMRARGIYADPFASYKGKSLFPGYDTWSYYSQMRLVFDADLQLRSVGMEKGKEMVFFSGSEKPGRLMIQIDKSKIGRARFMEGDRAVVQPRELWGRYAYEKGSKFEEPFWFFKDQKSTLIPQIDESMIGRARFMEGDRAVVQQQELFGRYVFSKSTGGLIKPVVPHGTGTPLKFYHSIKDVGLPSSELDTRILGSIPTKAGAVGKTITKTISSHISAEAPSYSHISTDAFKEAIGTPSYPSSKISFGRGGGYAMAYGSPVSLRYLEFLEEGLGFGSSYWTGIRPTRDTKHLGTIPSISPTLDIGNILGTGMIQAQASKLKTGQQLSQAQLSKLGIIQSSVIEQLFGVEQKPSLISEQASNQAQQQKLAQKLGLIQITTPITTTVLPPMLVTTEEEKPPKPIPPLIGEPIAKTKFTPFALWLPSEKPRRKKPKKKKKTKRKHGYRERVHPVGFYDWMGGV